MRVKGIIEEDFTNTSVLLCSLAPCFGTFKCCTEIRLRRRCAQTHLAKAEIKDISGDVICKHYISNPITSAIVFGGLSRWISPRIVRVHCSHARQL